MKKIFKMFLILPIFIVLAFFGVACEDDSLKSITVNSITNLTTSEEYIVPERGYYRLNLGDAFEVNISTNPNKYSITDLTWSSSDTYFVSVNNNILRALNVGQATITVSYRNANGEIIKTSFDVDVNAYAPEITFYNMSNNVEYRGVNLLTQNNLRFTADQDTSKQYSNGEYEFTYSYYDVNNKKICNEIINAGRYRITATQTHENGGVVSSTKEITVLPKTLNIDAGSFSKIYGDNLPEKVINESNVQAYLNSLDESDNIFSAFGVGKDVNLKVVKYVKYVSNNVNQASNIGSYNVKIAYKIEETDSDFKNNYTINTIDGNLNVLTKTIIVVPNDQIFTYGHNVGLNSFTIYSYEVDENGNWVGENGSIAHSLDKNFYSQNFIVNTPSFYLKDNDLIGSQTSVNSVGYLNANEYFYKLNISAINNNVKIANNFQIFESNSLENPLIKTIQVNKRDVTVCPNQNQSKVYLQNDPQNILYSLESGSFVGGDSIKNFLFINYPTLDIAGKTIDYGVYNHMAPVNTYFYEIKTTEKTQNASGKEEEVELNPNYNISLSLLAQHEETVADDTKIRFEVKPLSIYIELSDVTNQYKNSVSYNGSNIQTVSYFNKYVINNQSSSALDVNYFTNINKLVLNNKNIVENNNIVAEDLFDNIYIEKDTQFNQNGKFLIKYKNNYHTGEENSIIADEEIGNFYYRIDLGNSIPNTEYFESYYLRPAISCSLEEGNYSYNYFNSTTLNLTKITIKIYPNENASSMSKIYDATADLPNNFGLVKDGVISYTYDNLGEDGLTLNDVLQVKSTTNSFNPSIDPILSVNLKEGDVGSYKIELNNDYFENKSDYAYYNFVLNLEKDYYFTITPRTLTILPYSNQFKVYGSSDPTELKFSVKNIPTIVSGLESEETELEYDNLFSVNLSKKGSLSRVSGENVGTYQIFIGDLNFGYNYNVAIDNSPVNFRIDKRKIQVSPVEYTTTYGDDYPSEIAYSFVAVQNEENRINNEIYKAPEKKDFSGSFSLGVYNSETGEYVASSKVGNYYLSGSYSILQGTFNCSSNYEIEFISEKKFIINQRQIVLDFIPQNKTSTDVLNTEILNVPSSFYEIPTNVVDAPFNVVMDFLTLEATPSTYYVRNVTDAGLKIYKNGIDITSSYEIILGKPIVYTINVQAIDLVLLNKTNQLNNIQNVIYNGYNRGNSYANTEDFILVCQTEGYVINQENTSFKFVYRKGSESFDKVKNAGAYSVFVSLDENDKIAVKNTINNQIIEFNKNAIDEYLIVNNHLLNFSKVAYLNIEKANITYNQNELEFETTMQYGTNSLPNLKMGNVGSYVFKGVEIEENNFENVSFKEIISNTNLNSLYLGRNTIDLTLIPDTSITDNYNSLNVRVPLEVVPQTINYSSAEFTNISNLVYNGFNRITSLIIKDEDKNDVFSSLKNKYQITYDYRKLSATYNESTKAEVLYYDCLDGTISSEQRQTGLLNLGIEGINNFEVKGSYIIYDESIAFAYPNTESSIPVNAGVYICFANCVLDEHYTFASSSSEYPSGTSISFAVIFEIEKMGKEQIQINNWVEKFKYTTVFDFNTPSSLPFQYDVSMPELKSKVKYILNEKLENRPLNNILPVDNYKINLKIDEENYFAIIEKNFNIEKLDVRIVTPSTLTYVYNGNNISSYLQYIGAILLNKNNEVETTEYYYSNANNFTLFYYKIDNGEELISNDESNKTKNVGSYKLHIEYGYKNGAQEGKNPNYYGSGDYYFDIIPAPYTGTVTFKDSSMTYNPNYTAQDFYNYIINNKNVFNIDSATSDYSLKMYNVTKPSDEIVIYDGVDFNEDRFAEYFEVGQIKIRIDVEFDDETIANSSKEAWLTISPISITDREFLKYTTEISNSTYNGYKVYQDLTLLPQATTEAETWGKRLISNTFKNEEPIELNYNSSKYNVRYDKTADEYQISDKLGKKVFTLSYIYYFYNSSLLSSDKYEEIESAPISPGTYKVIYKIGVGKEYSKSTIFSTFTQKSYIIQKVEVLYISFSSDTVTYDGNNHKEKYKNASDLKSFKIANDPNVFSSNMKCTLTSDINHNYSEEEGVCLYVYFNEDNLINAGKYKINLTLVNNESYDISKYFNRISTTWININSFTSAVYTVYKTEEVQSDDFRNSDKSYKNVYENWLTISQAHITTSNYNLAIEFSVPIETKIDSSNNSSYLQINYGAIITNIKSCDVSLYDASGKNKICDLFSGYSFTEADLVISTEEEKTYYLLRFTGYNFSESYVKFLVVDV